MGHTPLEDQSRHDYRLVPIVVGVTGHRDIPTEDADKLRAAVKSQLAKLRENYPNTPLYFLSALAEGADRIAAEAALQTKGCALGVVLPMPAEEYTQDFETQHSKQEFRTLCKQAAFVHTVDPPTGQSQERALLYREAGLYIANQSQILIAFWDGENLRNKLGGTSDVVNTFRSGETDNTGAAIAIPEPGPVIHIKTRRLRKMDRYSADSVGGINGQSFLDQAQAAFNASETSGEPLDAEEFEQQKWQAMLRNIERFNRDVKDEVSKLEARNGDQGKPEYKTFQKKLLPQSCWASSGIYHVADDISYDTQRRRKIKLYLILFLAGFSIFSEQMYSIAPAVIFCPLTWMILTIISGLAAGGLYLWGRWNRFEERYLDYRALAEASRVQLFWKMAGLKANAADYYLRGQQDELEWIRQAVRSQELAIEAGQGLADKKDEESAKSAIRDVLQLWISDQRSYFLGDKADANSQRKNTGKLAQQKSLDEKWSKRAKWLFASAIATTIIAMAFRQFLMPCFQQCGTYISNGLSVSYNMLFALTAITKVYQEIMGFAEQANSYQKAGLYYVQAEIQLEKALQRGDLAKAQNIIFEMGKYALTENEEWLIIHRHRPLCVPVG
jgi:hypothetical protein